MAADFEEKLNAILSSPESMQQVAQLAQMLSAQSGGEPPPAQPGAPQPGAPAAPPQPSPGGAPELSALLGALDTNALARFLPLLQELKGGENDERARLLYALKPFLKPERQAKVDTALRLARLFRAGKVFFKEFGESHV